MDGPLRFVFVFPRLSGHINPSFPIARALVALGHEVHYVCGDHVREAVEDVGAKLHVDTAVMPELFLGRTPDGMGALGSLMKEYGIDHDSFAVSSGKLSNVMLGLTLPGLLRFMNHVKPSAVIFDPLASREGAFAAQVMHVSSIALLTIAGPGTREVGLMEFFDAENLSLRELEQTLKDFAPNAEAVQMLRKKYGLALGDFSIIGSSLHPFGKLDSLNHASATLVTTIEALQDSMSRELDHAYQEAGITFTWVGALLDVNGAKRAAGNGVHDAESDVLSRVHAARLVGRQVVLVSMGTVLVSDHPQLGWEGRQGKPFGLTGQKLCQAAWSGAFDAFRSDAAEEGALIVIALGPQPNALDDVVVPPNAICIPTLPQVDILRGGVDLFLTHGGQNSFTEALANSVPVVVCPGFADQPANGRKAVRLGVGRCVVRPNPSSQDETQAAAAYRHEVAIAMREVSSNADYKKAAARISESLQRAGGVRKAANVIVEAAKNKASCMFGHAGA